MNNKLIAYFNEIMSLSPEEMEGISATMMIRDYPKGTLLLRQGETSAEAYFVLEGCVRQYYLVETGEEKTNNFFTEGNWVISMKSISQGTPSDHFMECCVDSKLVVGNREKEDDLYSKFPRLQSVSRKVMEKVFAQQQEMLAAYHIENPEQRYLRLLKARPDLLEIIPQYQIASYIGVKPESLSRIRKRLVQKPD